MNAVENASEQSFVERLAAHLRENYGDAVVRLPDEEEAKTVAGLPAETLEMLVSRSIKRARSYGLSHQSAIAAFSALMFEVAPNFDSHKLSRMLLNDENTEPNARLNELLEVLTDKNWETIKEAYNPQEWQINNGEQNGTPIEKE